MQMKGQAKAKKITVKHVYKPSQRLHTIGELQKISDPSILLSTELSAWEYVQRMNQKEKSE